MTDHTQNTTTPSSEELQALSEEMNAWMKSTGRKKRFPRAKQDELAALGAKRCPKCRTVLRIEDFQKSTKAADGLQTYCRPCQNGANAAWREENPEAPREYHQARYATDGLFRMNAQLRDGKHRTLKAGGVVEDFDAADLLEFWKQQGIPADRDYFTDEPLDAATRSVDHLWSVSEGGPHARWALVPTAPLTNRMKGSKSPSEFRAWLRAEGIEPAERPDPTPFLIEALADRAAEQSNKEIDPLVQRALSTSAPARVRRNLVVSLEEEADRA